MLIWLEFDTLLPPISISIFILNPVTGKLSSFRENVLDKVSLNKIAKYGPYLLLIYSKSLRLERLETHLLFKDY